MERISVQREVNGESWRAVGALIGATRDFVTRHAMGVRQGHRLCIIVEELATNAFDHGDATKIALELEMMGGAVRVSMHDDGFAFDLRSHRPGDRPDAVSGGGAGIAMVRAWCEVIDYVSDTAGNRADLVLRIDHV